MQGTALHRLSLAVTAATLALSLGACRQGGDATPAAAKGGDRPDREWTDAARVEAIASALQACSYEGNAQNIVPGTLNGPAPGDCRAMVDKIMGYTGLPANFIVTAGPVDNAAAVILPDQQRIPQRVIAFNPDFITATQRLTGGGQWGPISIMAHEIGHHLSGHTITNGGSRPGIELEADKFSGFVLYKMGAPLAEATRAIDKLGSDTEQATHPAKSRRIAAITQGWQEACRQVAGNCAGGGTTPPSPPTGPATAPVLTKVSLPAPSAQSIPFKYGRFVVDETGQLNRDKLREFEQRLSALARDKGVEIALLFVNDLHGMAPEEYAWAMMRQLRVGKLDLGNGGVFVVAPKQGVAGAAMAPGVAKRLQFFDAGKRFDIWLKDGGWQRGCPGSDGCRNYTGFLTDVLGSQLRQLDTAWQIRFTSIEDAIAHSVAQEEQRRAARKAGKKPDWDVANKAGGSLARFTATVTDVAPKPDPVNPQSAKDLRVNRRIVADGRWKAVLVKTEDGQETTLYMQPQTASLMPSGQLQVGKQYTFVGEINSTGRFHTDQGVEQINPSLWLFSYEAL
jgi:hypothetical protein